MLTVSYSTGLFGIRGFLVTVECNGTNRLPAFEIVGLPDTAVKEAKERVRASLTNSGFPFPETELIVNLAPADKKKEGSAFDLAILVAILQCGRMLPETVSLEYRCFIGELSLGHGAPRARCAFDVHRGERSRKNGGVRPRGERR